jgi:hypothetical protein
MSKRKTENENVLGGWGLKLPRMKQQWRKKKTTLVQTRGVWLAWKKN